MAWGFGNSGSGASGYNIHDAILNVRTKTGATVTVSRGSVNKTLIGRAVNTDPTLSDYLFVVRASQFDSSDAWTITTSMPDALPEIPTVTKSIIIDSACEYFEKVTLRKYLLCVTTSPSGQTVADSYHWQLQNSGSLAPSFTTANKHGVAVYPLELLSNTAGTERWAYSMDSFDLTDYNTVSFDAVCGTATTNRRPRFAVTVTATDTSPTHVATLEYGTNNVSVNVSDLNNGYLKMSSKETSMPTSLYCVYAD